MPDMHKYKCHLTPIFWFHLILLLVYVYHASSIASGQFFSTFEEMGPDIRPACTTHSQIHSPAFINWCIQSRPYL
ncbi:hypothetical protein BDR06DRAFT_955912 [Suillus hirtellus]|nr:hypothetical protein BDR06DRAFT_955912 [Suillus hirtellus]